MKKRIGLILSLFIVFNTAWSVTIQKFDADTFKKLQHKNATILINIYATWCPTCSKQAAILEEYQKKYPKSDLHILKINFDKNKDLVRAFKAPRQSTFILFQGKKRKWMYVAETRPKVIFKALNKAVSKNGS